MEVGIKQAKNELSNLIVKAREGTRVFLVNRGERVAEIIPVVATGASKNRGLGMFQDQIKLPPRWGSQNEREKAERDLLKTIEDSD